MGKHTRAGKKRISESVRQGHARRRELLKQAERLIALLHKQGVVTLGDLQEESGL